jgi:O-antigen/teichoic acid export membrane protein
VSSPRPPAVAEPPPPRELRSVARGGSLNVIGYLASGVLGFVLTVVVTRGLGVSGAGVFFSAVAVFTILANVTELGADTGAVRFVASYRARGRHRDVGTTVRVALIPAAIASILAAAVVIVGAESVAHVFARDRPGDVAAFLRLIGPFLPFATLTAVALAVTRGFGSMRPFVAIEGIGKPGLRPALILVLGIGGLTTREVALGWGLPEAVACAAAFAALAAVVRSPSARHPDAPPARPVREIATEFWRFSAPRGVAAAFQVSVFWVDVLLLGRYRPSGDVGVYAAASRVAMVGTFALQAIRIAIAPQISKLLAREDRATAQIVYQTTTWWLIAVSWPLFLLLAVFAELVLSVFGPGFGVGGTALAILSLAMLVNLGTGNVTVVLLMGGKSSWNLVNTVVAITVNVVLNVLLIPPYGMEGAAVAWAATIVVENLLALVQVWVLLGMRPFGPGYLPVTSAAVVCVGGVAVASRAVVGDGLAGLVAAVVIGGILYGAVLWRLRRRLHLDTFLASLRGGGDADESERRGTDDRA